MIFQTAMTASLAEVAFRSVVSAITKTSTVASLQEGEPVILDTTAADGMAVGRALTSTTLTNNLWVGVVKGTITHEGVGLAQCYGKCSVRLAASVTAAAGDPLIPQVNSTATQITGGSAVSTAGPLYGGAATGTTSNVAINGLTGAAIALAASTASTDTAGASTVTAHLRLM